MKTDPRTDAAIAAAKPFAQRILTHVRALFHKHLPDGEETKKWGASAFVYKDSIVSMMMAFKDHATFGFWYGKAVTGDTGYEDTAMGSFGRLKSLADLPSDEAIATMIAKSIELIDAGVKPPQYAGEKKPPKPEAEMPPALALALAANPVAQSVWDKFTPAQRREYCEWVGDAKREETREKRVTEGLGWIADGKKRNWKYENC